MKRVRINANAPYDVVVGAGLTSMLPENLRQIFRGKSCVIVTDETVSPLYVGPLIPPLIKSGYKPSVYAFPPGENSKTMETLSNILGFMAEKNLTAGDFILCVGGGIPGDVGGFAAAVYKRGIGFAVMPTTLLAMADSSVGGKTAVNLPAGKNLAGAFHQPSIVLCDTDALKTLPRREYINGLAEVIKYGILRDRALFDKLSASDSREISSENNAGALPAIPPDIEDIISRCVTHKAHFVEVDEHDRRERRKLNLGHTIGHAVELAGNFSHTHGEAVAIGMAAIARASERMGVAEKGTAAIIIKALTDNGLPTATDISPEKLLAAILRDKKRAGAKIDLILPVKIGKCVIRPVNISELPAILANSES